MVKVTNIFAMTSFSKHVQFCLCFVLSCAESRAEVRAAGRQLSMWLRLCVKHPFNKTRCFPLAVESRNSRRLG